MRSIALLVFGIHVAFAGLHSLKYFYTSVCGDIVFPMFTTVGVVDDSQFVFFDTNTMKASPKTEWIRQIMGEDYWKRETEFMKAQHKWTRNYIQIPKDHLTGIHTYQIMYGCHWDNKTGATSGFRRFAFDGEELVYLDFKEMKWKSHKEQEFNTQRKCNNKTVDLYWKHFFDVECIETLKNYVQHKKNNLEKTDSLQVYLLQNDLSSPVTCHATGFYSREVKVSWQKNRGSHPKNVDHGKILPNGDGTFQKTSTLRVTPEEWKKNQYSCVVEHQGKTISKILTENEIWTNKNQTQASASLVIIAGVVAVSFMIIIAVIGFMVYKKKRKSGFVPANTSDTSSKESTQSIPMT